MVLTLTEHSRGCQRWFESLRSSSNRHRTIHNSSNLSIRMLSNSFTVVLLRTLNSNNPKDTGCRLHKYLRSNNFHKPTLVEGLLVAFQASSQLNTCNTTWIIGMRIIRISKKEDPTCMKAMSPRIVWLSTIELWQADMLPITKAGVYRSPTITYESVRNYYLYLFYPLHIPTFKFQSSIKRIKIDPYAFTPWPIDK